MPRLRMEDRPPPPSSGTPVPGGLVVMPTPDDLDGDGMPNAWETANSHNPNDPTDAARDFDNDGLTTLQEYQLSRSSNGVHGNRTGDALREHGEKEAERIVRRSLNSGRLAPGTKALSKLPKSDRRKGALANGWIAARLAMRHPGSVSRMLGACKSDVEIISIRTARAKELDQRGKDARK